MKTIRVKFCDGFHEEDFVFMPILKKHYNVIEAEDPEYLFYSVFGQEHIKYSNCIKIFSTGEAVVPNFNECDYATGFDYLELGDRYLRLPLCSIMYRDGKNVLDSAKDRGSQLPKVDKKEFCSFVVSNGNGMPERKRMLELLNEYKTVNSGGRYLNNVGGPVEDKLLFEHRHKFSLCFENERYPGYTTEKIVDAFSAGTVPIYLGDPRIGEYFNEKAFVNVCDFDTPEDAVEYIKRLDADDELYNRVMAQPMLKKELPGLRELEEFLCHIIDSDPEAAKRAPQSAWAKSAMYVEVSPYQGRVFDMWIKPYNLYRKARQARQKNRPPVLNRNRPPVLEEPSNRNRPPVLAAPAPVLHRTKEPSPCLIVAPCLIPKKIHFIWLSDNPFPENTLSCINSWKKYAGDYDIKRWAMKDFAFSTMPAFVNEAIQKEKWAFACDYLRLYVLEKEGGIYLDSDVLMLESPDRFLKSSFFSAVEYYPDLFEKYGKANVDENGGSDALEVAGMSFQAAVMGSVAHHPFTKEVMSFYENNSFILEDGSLNNRIIAPQIYAGYARRHGFKYRNEYQELDNGVVLYPSELIAPGYRESTRESALIHLCAASWRDDVSADYAEDQARQIKEACRRRHRGCHRGRLIRK